MDILTLSCKVLPFSQRGLAPARMRDQNVLPFSLY